MSRIVAVTGATGGIGRATVREFARRGDDVALIARGEGGLDAAAEEVRSMGRRALVVPTDVADDAAVEAAVERIETELGPVDVWVNVAFTSVFARFEDIAPEEYRRVTEVNYLGYVYATMAILKRMRQRGHGTIVHVGSTLAYRGIPLQTAYCGSKHALQGFHESLRVELLHEGSDIHVTMVQMPAVNTPQFSWVLSRLPKHAQPVPPIYQPEIAARAVVYAADHPKRREYWVGASTVGTLIANAVAPGILDRYLAKTGFSSQQTSQDKPDDQPANLWEPADGPDDKDFGAHGVFDDTAKARSPQQWVAHRYPQLAGAAAGALALGLGALALGRRS
jgi:NAD(P)-dependent dehydrogenase (short-subunit alcohol dehydrogenase family)